MHTRARRYLAPAKPVRDPRRTGITRSKPPGDRKLVLFTETLAVPRALYILASAMRLSTDQSSTRTGRRLNAGRVLAALLLNVVLLGIPSAAAAFEQPMGDAWWAPTPPADKAQPASKTPTHFFGVGDSVMLGASGELRQAIPGIEIDAVVGRQASTGIDILRARAAAGEIPEVVIFGLGTNGPMTRRQIDQAMDALTGVQRVVIVNNSMPRNWEAPNNALLADAVHAYPNAVLADWYGLTTAQPDLLVADSIHVAIRGARAYATLIAPLATAPLPA